MRRTKYIRDYRIKIILFLSICLLYYFGALTHIFELDYHTQFSYQLDRNITNCIISLTDNRSECEVINSYNYNYSISNGLKCSTVTEPIWLVILVKSAVGNFQKRVAIRNSWGFEKRFSDVTIKTIFVVGKKDNLDAKVIEEHRKYGDMVQVDFVDSYYNNSIKTMMMLKWATLYCDTGKFYLFSDDDMYISIKNVLSFVRNPTQYPSYLKSSINDSKNHLKQVIHYELPDEVKLYAGHVIVSTPHRHLCSKWYVSLAEYPFHLFPPYITGGSYILSRTVLKELYYASYFTKHFRFDDVYLGMLAKKINLELFHSEEFHFHKVQPDKLNYNFAIASHGYGDPLELLKVWNEQKSFGNA